jgi:hypothetical protein
MQVGRRQNKTSEEKERRLGHKDTYSYLAVADQSSKQRLSFPIRNRMLGAGYQSKSFARARATVVLGIVFFGACQFPAAP